jgi:type IV pilus assembly protein PilA
MNRNKGFTIIELMAVVAILSILAVIAINAYSGYIVRSKVSEGLAFASEAKTAVSGYYSIDKQLPQNNRAAGLPEPDTYNKLDYISRLELSSTTPFGTIILTFKIPGTSADGKELHLVPSTADEAVSWTCKPPAVNGLTVNQVPANCRG